MITYSTNADVVTSVAIWQVTADQQDRVARAVAELAERILAGERGFRMCVTHRSLDGTQVLCWAQWDSYEDLALVLNRKDIIQSAQQAIGGEAPHFVLYDVAAVVRGAERETAWRASDLLDRSQTSWQSP